MLDDVPVDRWTGTEQRTNSLSSLRPRDGLFSSIGGPAVLLEEQLGRMAAVRPGRRMDAWQSFEAIFVGWCERHGSLLAKALTVGSGGLRAAYSDKDEGGGTLAWCQGRE